MSSYALSMKHFMKTVFLTELTPNVILFLVLVDQAGD
jgi:hypothetical protein